MVLRLSATLNIPLRQSNELLLAAGYAPIWGETDFNGQELAPVREAFNYILAHQEPFPAVVVDRRWNLRQANKGAIAMVEFLVGPVKPGTAINLADALVAPDVLRPHLTNWSDVAHYFVRSVEADAAADGTPETAALLERLRATRACERRCHKCRHTALRPPCWRCTLRKAEPSFAFSPLSLRLAHPKMSHFRSYASRASFRWIARREMRLATGLRRRKRLDQPRHAETDTSFPKHSGSAKVEHDPQAAVVVRGYFFAVSASFARHEINIV